MPADTATAVEAGMTAETGVTAETVRAVERATAVEAARSGIRRARGEALRCLGLRKPGHA